MTVIVFQLPPKHSYIFNQLNVSPEMIFVWWCPWWKYFPSVDVLLISKWTNRIFQTLVLPLSLVEFMMSWSISVIFYNSSIRGRSHLRRSEEFSELKLQVLFTNVAFWKYVFLSYFFFTHISYIVIFSILIQIYSKYLPKTWNNAEIRWENFNIRLRKITR